jgi:hypothetical protein
MSFRQVSLLLIGLTSAWMPSSVTAAEPATHLAAKLPEPLNTISSNLPDLEQGGYFAITKSEFGRTKERREEAVLWTVKVVRPLSCRHAVGLLRKWGDVRFYRHLKDRRLELLSAELYYASWIDTGAINNETLKEDSEFQLWVLLDDRAIRMLKLRNADAVQFGPVRR